jgi:chemotaxis protein methyltransferase CheR
VRDAAADPAGAPAPRAAPLGDDVEAIEVRLFLEAIHDRYGYDLRDYAAPSMRRRVQVALAKSAASDLGALQHRVLSEPETFARVLADLTVQVSELYRDPAFYLELRARVVPVLRTYPLLNVWHAGCATGEEAYSTAVLLREEGLLDRCQIYATDLSAPALERAKQGVFATRDRAAVDDRYRRAGGAASLEAHATFAYDQIAFHEAVRRRIVFFQHDLVADYVFAEMHVVFCRNVLIYFGRDLRARVLDKLERSLCRGGFLCLGTSERLPTGDRGPFVEVGAERIYRLRGAP